MKKHALFDTYSSMHQRCENENNPSYRNYGAKGVKVCARWHKTNLDGFSNFVADMGPKPSPAHTVERRDNTKGYGPDNCRWATRQEQMLNTSRTVEIVDDQGVAHTTISLAERYGIKRSLIAIRFHQGKSFAEITSTHHLAPGYDHLAEAIAKSAALNHARTHCKWGHELTPENVAIGPKTGYRGCKKCNAEKTARHRYNKKLG
jgi:hypothetical protein